MKKIKQVRIEEAVWQRAKGAAALEGLTLEEWMTRAIEERLATKALLRGFTTQDLKAIRRRVETGPLG